VKISKENAMDFIADTAVANVVSMSFILPFYYITGMDATNLMRVFWSFWTIGWFASLAIVGALRVYRSKYPYRSDRDDTERIHN